MKKLFLVPLLVLALTGCSHSSAPQPFPIPTTPPPASTPIVEKDPIKDKLASMSLEEKIGQMMIVGFTGTQLQTEEKEFIASQHLGGVILFGPNIVDKSQLLSLINDIKSSNPVHETPLFISVDEEGGRVSRLPAGKTIFPTNLDIGKKNNPNISREVGRVIGEELSTFGFNLDFAPVLDIYSNAQNTVIGNRSFGNTPSLVSSLGIATMKGIQDSFVIPVVKHFPGHGDTTVDSHVGLPVVNKTKKQLEDCEFIPFKDAVSEGADMVMVAHIQYPQLDPSLHPASLSKVLITDILRNQLQFNGVVITDDLEMGAIEQQYGSGEAALLAMGSGADIVLFGHTPQKARDACTTLINAVQKGLLPIKRIDDSVLRILRLKEKYNLNDKKLPQSSLDSFGSLTHKNVADRLK